MLFSSLVFLWFFLPAAVFLYYLAPGRNAKNIVLFAASLIFYGWGGPRYLLLVLLTALLCYAAGLCIDAAGERTALKKLSVGVFVLITLGILGYFKYYNFFAATAGRLAGKELFPLRDIVLPLGISFYTFQAISYVVDVYRGKSPAQKNLFHMALYLFLFPQILSGPIIKYHQVAGQLTNRNETISIQFYGIKRFVYGLAKKVLLANTFGQSVDYIMGVPSGQMGTLTAWLAVILYTLQIYYDFSGYSDMAIGLGRIFGFYYEENFNYPYLSSSITEFWRRWHISLSTWFRNYLYIPLGGNRKGLGRTCVNLFIVFLATGLWHGASMTFIIWGIYHGLFILSERLWLKKVLDRNPVKFLNHLYAMVVVVFGWLLFRAPSMTYAIDLAKAMIRPSKGLWNAGLFANNKILFLAVLGILLCGPVQALFPRFRNHIFDEENVSYGDIAVMIVLLFLSTMVVVSSTYTAFIYFQF
ncbi:MBOAT family O-acyltransferase [[Clostridium] symbiosum]|uniref:MBOAT family O-acyltransferase n=1 Tax=Clostridium symbiosum TaxID=1512 RepID=UPI00232D49B9|nr:MBOAT family O-acyltransferase [[Clostridium] symbiosum]MDB2007629.1 MBOAT family protein [[Clostridium] symbiosum]MDB2025261.1 MBOAT family protein [[Clostridium] symbiosum]